MAVGLAVRLQQRPEAAVPEAVPVLPAETLPLVLLAVKLVGRAAEH